MFSQVTFAAWNYGYSASRPKVLFSNLNWSPAVICYTNPYCLSDFLPLTLPILGFFKKLGLRLLKTLGIILPLTRLCGYQMIRSCFPISLQSYLSTHICTATVRLPRSSSITQTGTGRVRGEFLCYNFFCYLYPIYVKGPYTSSLVFPSEILGSKHLIPCSTTKILHVSLGCKMIIMSSESKAFMVTFSYFLTLHLN